MKKLIVWILVLLFCLTFWFFVICGIKKAFAGQWAIGQRVSAFNGDDDNLPNLQLQNSLNFGYFMKYLGIELETNYGRFHTSKNDWSDGSKFTITGGTLNLQARLPLNKRLTLYGVYGYGRDFFINKKIAFNESLNVKSSNSAKYGGGVEWKLNEKWALNGEATYHYSDSGNDSTIDSWGWLYSLGLKYKF